MLNPNKIIEKNNDPFPYLVIRDFFDKNFYEQIEKEFPKKDKFIQEKDSVGRMHYDTTFGYNLYQETMDKSGAYKELHNYIYSKNFVKTFLDLFDNEINNEIDNDFLNLDVRNLEINQTPFEVGEIFNKKNLKAKEDFFLYPRLDIGFGEKDYGIKTGGKGIHVDNPQRLISILFYAGGYSNIEGGEHRLWRVNDEKIEIAKEIKPNANLLIASLQNNISYHDVNPITEITGTRNAFYIAISCNNPIWKNIKVNDFNLKYNRNRCKLGFLSKIKKRLFA